MEQTNLIIRIILFPLWKNVLGRKTQRKRKKCWEVGRTDIICEYRESGNQKGKYNGKSNPKYYK